MKFDFVIGNPPYQDETLGDNKGFAPPIYDKFMEATYKVADKVELIHPARFLFNAGSTPKDWNEKMLSDPHFKVLFYEQDSSKLFKNTDIKGGVAITYHDNKKNFGIIGAFTSFPELNSLKSKVFESKSFKTIMDYVYIQVRFNLDELYADFPDIKNSLGSDGKDRRLEKNIFTKASVLFTNEKVNENDIKIIGTFNNKRTYRFIQRKYIDLEHENLNKYKVIIPASNGSGAIGETLSTPLVGVPLVGYTRSFIGLGAFNTEEEANACLKYIKGKFSRTCLGILKITQMNNKDVWKYVPLQDFTPESDIDWSKSIAEIDQQLYKKYNLSKEEIDFIENNVKAMD